MGARYLCKHNISDEDCYKCGIHGLIFESECRGCPDFADMRNDMPPEIQALREKIMRENGLKDKED